jgi:hypothetical protein
MSARRRAPKSTERKAAKPVKLTFTVSVETAERFGVHATMEHLGNSELFTELVDRHLRKWVVSDRSKATEPMADAQENAPG